MGRMREMSEKMKARNEYVKAKKKYPLGQGGRFKALVASVKAGGAKNPEATAAAIGRNKYGASRFAKLAAAGRKK